MSLVDFELAEEVLFAHTTGMCNGSGLHALAARCVLFICRSLIECCVQSLSQFTSEAEEVEEQQRRRWIGPSLASPAPRRR